jgi:hypothetical protein
MLLHEVGHNDGDGARDADCAVDKDIIGRHVTAVLIDEAANFG